MIACNWATLSRLFVDEKTNHFLSIYSFAVLFLESCFSYAFREKSLIYYLYITLSILKKELTQYTPHYLMIIYRWLWDAFSVRLIMKKLYYILFVPQLGHILWRYNETWRLHTAKFIVPHYANDENANRFDSNSNRFRKLILPVQSSVREFSDSSFQTDFWNCSL